MANEARVQIGSVTYEHNPYYPADQICYQSYSADLEVDVGTEPALAFRVTVLPTAISDPSPTSALITIPADAGA